MYAIRSYYAVAGELPSVRPSPSPTGKQGMTQGRDPHIMTKATQSAAGWEVLTQPSGEVLAAEAHSPGLHLGLLGVSYNLV